MPPGQRKEQTTGKIEEKGRIKAPRLSRVRFSASSRWKAAGCSVAPRCGVIWTFSLRWASPSLHRGLRRNGHPVAPDRGMSLRRNVETSDLGSANERRWSGSIDRALRFAQNCAGVKRDRCAGDLVIETLERSILKNQTSERIKFRIVSVKRCKK